MNDFPTISTGHDSAKYGIEVEDPAMKTEMEGGYVVSRAKHTRIPRRTWKSGFTDISNADKVVIEDFFDEQRGGSKIFSWTDPQSKMNGAPGKSYLVRFEGPILYTYKGMGHNARWDLSYSVQQA